jgi:hypothetical protein
MKYNLPEYKDMKEEDLPSEFKTPVPDGIKWGRIEELEQTVYLLRYWRSSEDKRIIEKLKLFENSEKELLNKNKEIENEINIIKNNIVYKLFHFIKLI